VTTIAVIGVGILTWILIAILLSLFLARVIGLNRPKVPAVELSPGLPVGKPALNTVEAMAEFPAQPPRFVGHDEVMAAASAALPPASGRTAVVFHGTGGAGKTTCAVELSYRHRHGFRALAFWSAPTDPEQSGDALRLLALELEAQLGSRGFTIVDKIVTEARLKKVQPVLTAAFADAGLLLVLDNLETLLTPDGQWRDPRWALLINALTGHGGPSRVIMTSRILPDGLDPDAVLIRPVHALSRDESLLLIGELPALRALLDSVALARCLLTLTQGHPQLLEFADAAAADPPRLAYQLAEIEAAVNGTAPLAAFLAQGRTRLDATQLRHTFTTWTRVVTATAPAPARLLLQALCRMEETDRSTAVIEANWPALWRRLDQPGEPPPVASIVAPLISAVLVATDHERYRIHPDVAEAIHAITPEPVIAAVDEQLAAWWTAVVGGWEIAPQQIDEDTGQVTVRASLAAARYLLRRHDWNAASCLLERALIRDGYSPVTSLAVVPLLRRIAEATGALKDLLVLGAALRKVDPDEAEIRLRRAYYQAITDGEHQFASTTAGELVALLRDQGRLYDALAMARKKIEHTSQGGFGLWTQLSDQGRRLQILNLLGHHEQVLIDLPALRDRMADLPDQRAHNDRVNPWNVRECILDIGRLSAVALERWDDALDLNGELVSTKQRRGAGRSEIARSRCQDYLPLFQLGRPTDADQLLRDCQDIFAAACDSTQLAVVYGARADLEDKRNHSKSAVDLQRTSLHLWYLHPDLREISSAHHNLADYLSHVAVNSAEQRAHRLTAALLSHLTGNTPGLARALGMLVAELRSDTSGPDTPALPATLRDVIRLVEADNGVCLGNLVVALCPEPTTAEHALADLLSLAKQGR
jgi:hypothetical protein